MPSLRFFLGAMGLSHCWRQDGARWCHWALQIPQIPRYIGTASTAQAWTSTVAFRYLCFLSFLPLFCGPVTSWAPAAALVGTQRAHLEAAGCPNLQHNTALHITFLPTVLCPLRVGEKASSPAATGNCTGLGRLCWREQRAWFAALDCSASSQPSLPPVLQMNKDFPGLSVLRISPAFPSL